jgi:enamine deaminase RidA (YjgF/YER057c/UK114 family)
MTIEHIAPEDLLPSKNLGYSQVVKTDARTTVYIAGQGAVDKEMKLVGEGDYHAQTKQALRNLTVALAAAGATPENIVSSVIYLVGLDEKAVQGCAGAFPTAWDGKPFPPNASSMIGVERLMLPGMLVEISAIAVVEEGV